MISRGALADAAALGMDGWRFATCSPGPPRLPQPQPAPAAERCWQHVMALGVEPSAMPVVWGRLRSLAEGGTQPCMLGGTPVYAQKPDQLPGFPAEMRCSMQLKAFVAGGVIPLTRLGGEKHGRGMSW